MRTIINTIRGLLASLIFIFNCIIFPIPILLLALLILPLPKTLRQHMDTFLQKAPWLWTLCNSFAAWVSAAPKPEIILPAELSKDKPYLVIANHQTWVDILVLFYAFNFKIPPLKFFMKKELLWSLPVAGITCKAMGFPFMERHSREDIRKNPALKGRDVETTRKACRKFLEVSSSLMNFVEGTRFSQKKHQKQASPYKNLLKPKAGGISIVLEEMHDSLADIIDVTLAYDTEDYGFWSYVSGGMKHIRVEARLLPIQQELIGDYSNDREFRPKFQAWLNDIWLHKDQHIEEIKQSWQ